MPLINGQKMACEPCIRGHRSTKCTHASERLMVPVRKPGRPLSSCPHPSAQPCGCAAVTAAFPRKQKCRRCETSDKPSGCKPGGQEDKETSNGLVTPPSPSQKAPAPKTTYRIQKTSSKNGTGKKQIDLSGLERMDASQLNILSSPESKPSPSQLSNGTVPTTPAAPLPGQGMMGFISNGRSFSLGPAMFPLQSGLECLVPVNGHIDAESLRPNESNAGPAAGSCCGGGNSNFPPTHAQSLANADSSGTEIKPRGSISTPGVGPPINGLIMPQFNAQMNMPNVPFPYFAQPGVFAYPPQYGSFQQPLQPDQWRQLMATMHFTHPMPNMQDAPYDETAQVQFPQNNGLEAPWTSHQCGCGDSCECIGCATHPYNQATQDYVRSAWNSMQEDAPKGHRHSDSTHSPLIGNNGTPTPANQSPNGGSTPTGGQVEGLVSPTMAQTPSESNSVLGEEAALSASDFFFVSYPFGDLCEGEKAKCPCGDDCSCIGCSIHNISPAPAEFGST